MKYVHIFFVLIVTVLQSHPNHKYDYRVMHTWHIDATMGTFVEYRSGHFDTFSVWPKCLFGCT